MKERPILPFGLGIVLLVAGLWHGEPARSEPVMIGVTDRVELAGAVTDASRVPIPDAVVRVDSLASATGDDGRYTMLVRRGYVAIEASAPGYATARRTGAGEVDLVLVPEATLAGVVVDAAGAPRAGVTVTAVAIGPDRNEIADPRPVVSDPVGRFRLANLAASRYAISARNAHGFGYHERTIDEAQHVTDLVVPLAPAHQVSGRVVIEPENQTCRDGGFMLHDETHDRYVDVTRAPDGTLTAPGVLPGSYTVTAWCDGYVSRERYPSLAVSHDVGGLVWPVSRGITMRGRVVSQHGAPIADASVTATMLGGDGYAREQVGVGGTYELRGLRPGRYEIKVARPHSFGTVPAVESTVVVELPRDAERELVLPDTSGTLEGHIMSPDHGGVPAVYVTATRLRDGWSGRVRADDAGHFELANIPPGDYQLAVEGQPDAPVEVAVRSGYVMTVPLLVSAR